MERVRYFWRKRDRWILECGERERRRDSEEETKG